LIEFPEKMGKGILRIKIRKKKEMMCVMQCGVEPARQAR